MNIRVGILIVIVWLTWAATGVVAQSEAIKPSSRDEFWSAWQSAVMAAEPDSLQSMCAPGFWEADGLNGLRFREQVIRKQLEMQLRQWDSQTDRAVVTVVLTRDQRMVDTVYLYLEHVDGKSGWHWAGVDEMKGHVSRFLRGQLPARFTMADCVASPKLKQLGEAWIKLRRTPDGRGDASDPELALKQLGLDPGSASLRRWREMNPSELKVDETLWSEAIQRGAIAFDDGQEVQFMYLERIDDGWKLLDSSRGWFRMECLLK